jgi:Mg2+/Co2+ transporter CorB
MSLTVDALIVLASIFASAFFSAAETALTAASRARMHALEMDGSQPAKLVNRLIAMRGRLISAMLLGGQVVNIAASSFATSLSWSPATAASSMRP